MPAHLFLQTLGGNWRAYRKNRLGVVGLVFLSAFTIMGVLAPLIAPYAPLETGTGNRLMGLSSEHWMGTDDLGRDIWSGWVWGIRTAILVACFASTLATLIGIVVGSIAGYYGSKVDTILMRGADLILTLPLFILALAIVSLFGASIWNVVAVIGILGWPSTARLIRAEFLRLRELAFVDAARIVGAADRTIVFSEILPNALAPAIVNASIQGALAILVEAGLSFVGLNDPNVVSWGRILSNAQPFASVAWWYAFFPGLGISMMAFAFNVIGDALNEVLRPELK